MVRVEVVPTHRFISVSDDDTIGRVPLLKVSPVSESDLVLCEYTRSGRNPGVERASERGVKLFSLSSQILLSKKKPYFEFLLL